MVAATVALITSILKSAMFDVAVDWVKDIIEKYTKHKFKKRLHKHKVHHKHKPHAK